jgi:hypothetical protein
MPKSQTTSKSPRYTFGENMLLHAFGISPEKKKELRQLGLSDAIEMTGGKRKASRRKLTASRNKRRASRRKRYTRK